MSSAELLQPSGSAQSRSPGSLKDEIVRVAVELGTELGEDGLTMRAIASKLGVSATALYQHFKEGKPSIVRAVRFHGLHLLNEAVAPAFELSDPMESIHQAVARYIEFGRKNPWLYRVLFEGEEVDYATLRESEKKAIAFSQTQSRRCFTAAQKDGKIRADIDIDTAPFLLWGAAHGLTALMISGRISEKHPGFPVKSESEFIAKFVDLAVRGFTPC